MSSTASSRKPHVVGGKLKLKGSGGSSGGVKRSTGSSSSSSHERVSEPAQETSQASQKDEKKTTKAAVEEYLTPSQKRHQERKIEKEKLEAKKLSKTSFRDRVDIFNNKLAAMTEHNDIPRISAAGNG